MIAKSTILNFNQEGKRKYEIK